MNQRSLQAELSSLGLGDLRYFDSVGSTNDEALAWATEGAPDLSVVIADEQTAGRGRLGRKWFTPPGTALAFSLIVRPSSEHRSYLARTVGLAGLAVAESLQKHSIPARIKWPNDVLVLGRKIAGILVEAVWTGDEIDCQVIGFGVNVRKDAVPYHVVLQMPTTSLEEALGSTPQREDILREILSTLMRLRPGIGTDEFVRTWEHNLAYLGERVTLQGLNEAPISGDLLGLEADGSLRIRDERGNPVTVRSGDVSLRQDG